MCVDKILHCIIIVNTLIIISKYYQCLNPFIAPTFYLHLVPTYKLIKKNVGADDRMWEIQSKISHKMMQIKWKLKNLEYAFQYIYGLFCVNMTV